MGPVPGTRNTLILVVLALFSYCVTGQSNSNEFVISWPQNSSHNCPADPVTLQFTASGGFSGCYLDGTVFRGSVTTSNVPPDKIAITLVFTVDRPNVLHSLNCCVLRDNQVFCSPLVWLRTEAIPSASANLSLECSGTNIYNCTLRWEHPPNIKNTSLLMYCFNITKESGDVVVQDVCTKATQYSFAVSHLDWCDSYKVTSTSSCNMARGNTTTVALKPTEGGLLSNEVTYHLSCTNDWRTHVVVDVCFVNHCNASVQIGSDLKYSNGRPCVTFTVPSDNDVYKAFISSGLSRISLNISKSSGIFGVQQVVASLSSDGGNLTTTCFFAPGSCTTGCFLIMHNGASVYGLLILREGNVSSATTSVPAQGLVFGPYKGTAYSRDPFGLLTGGPSAIFSLNVSTHNQSPATHDTRLMCLADRSSICCRLVSVSSVHHQYIVVSVESGGIVEKTAGAVTSSYCSQKLPRGNYIVIAISNSSSERESLMSDIVKILSPSGSTETRFAAIVIVPIAYFLLIGIAVAIFWRTRVRAIKKQANIGAGIREISGGGGLGEAVGQLQGVMPQLDDLSVLGGVPLGASMLGVPLGSVLGVEEGTVGSNAGDQLCVVPHETNDCSSSTLPVMSDFKLLRAPGKSNSQRIGHDVTSSDLNKEDSNPLQSFINEAQPADTQESTRIEMFEMKPRTDAILTKHGSDSQMVQDPVNQEHMPVSNVV